jgi:hypothetical protein
MPWLRPSTNVAADSNHPGAYYCTCHASAGGSVSAGETPMLVRGDDDHSRLWDELLAELVRRQPLLVAINVVAALLFASGIASAVPAPTLALWLSCLGLSQVARLACWWHWCWRATRQPPRNAAGWLIATSAAAGFSWGLIGPLFAGLDSVAQQMLVPFFLGRQNWLAEELLEPVEIGYGVTAKLRAQHTGMPTALEAGAHFTPAPPIGSGQIAGVLAAQPGGETGGEPHRTAQHDGRAVGLAAGRPPLVTAV